MTVASGVLVLAALILLVVGLVQPSLALVYASIGASVVAFALLAAAVRRRRHEVEAAGRGPG